METVTFIFRCDVQLNRARVLTKNYIVLIFLIFGIFCGYAATVTLGVAWRWRLMSSRGEGTQV